jgi:hypothetical protein
MPTLQGSWDGFVVCFTPILDMTLLLFQSKPISTLVQNGMTQARLVEFAELIQIVQQEINQIVAGVEIQFTWLDSLPQVEGEDYFVKLDPAESDAYQYWIDWVSTMGAWVDAQGQQVTVAIRADRAASQFDRSSVIALASHAAATCLCLRGEIAIHANVVAIHGHAIAFAGSSGRGKSTLTAYCASRGAGFVTDDVLVLDQAGRVQLGSDRIKLLPQTAAQFGLDTAHLKDYKLHCKPMQLGAQRQTQPVPLKAIYLLADPGVAELGDRIYAERLAAGAALIQLMLHSYHTLHVIQDQPQLFYRYTQLLNMTPVYQLHYPRSFEQLPHLYAYLEQEVLK